MMNIYEHPLQYGDRAFAWKQFNDLFESPTARSLSLDQFLLFELGKEQLTSLILRAATGAPPEKNLVLVGDTLPQEFSQEPGIWFFPDVLHVTDKLKPLASFVADLGGKSIFISRVKQGEYFWGCLVGYSKEHHDIAANEISLFSLLTSGMSLLVENVQLRNGTTFRLSEALSLETVSSALVKSESLDKILALIIDEAVRLLNAKDALVLLLEDGDEWFEVIECLGSDLDTLAHRRLSVKNSLNGMVVLTGEPLISINAQTDPRADRHRALDLNVHDAIIAPLKNRGRTIGTIAIHNKNDGHFCRDDINVLCSFANQAAIAINNAQLYSDLLTARNEIQQKAQELQELLVQMINIQEKERYRIAADFHDAVVSQIVGTLYEVEGCIQLNNESNNIDGKLQLLKQMLNEAIERTRRSIYNLWPATLDHMSLIPALHEMFKQQEKTTGLPHTVHVNGTPYQLQPDVQIVIYRIVQEAMNNAIRHGAASLISLSVRFNPQQLSIKVRDNGHGFDVEQVMKSPIACHYGLILMKERAQSIGGTLTIKSVAGEGSQVNLVLSNIKTIQAEGFQEFVAIRLLIVDDQLVVRQGLRSMLVGADDIEIVGDASNADEAIKQATTLQPDVILLDIRMPGVDGLQMLKYLCTNLPQIKVIILTNYDEEQFLFEAFRAGAYGYLLKNVSRDILLDALRAAKAGKRMLSQELMDSVLKQYPDLSRRHTQDDLGLCDEEVNLLKLVSEGITNREIAKQLFWSETAVKRKLSGVFLKLDATDRAQAVAVAMRRGLI